MLASVIATGGQYIAQELHQEQVKHPRRKVLKTNGHSLPCRHVLHLNISKNREDIIATVVEAFVEAGRLGATTVAIPCFGSRLVPADCAAFTFEAFKKFLQNSPNTCVSTIYIVLVGKAIETAYLVELGKFNGKKGPELKESAGSSLAKVIAAAEAGSSRGAQLNKPLTTELLFCGKSIADIDQARAEVEDFSKVNAATKLVENESLRSMKEKDHEVFKIVEEKFAVTLKYDINKYKKMNLH